LFTQAVLPAYTLGQSATLQQAALLMQVPAQSF
jgi:hypothetical protein